MRRRPSLCSAGIPAVVALSLVACGDSTAPPVATRLAFGAQPTASTVGVTIAPSIEVQVLDADGEPFPGFTGSVTVALGANPGDATLSGTLTVAAVDGVARFSDLSIDKGEDGYTLVATSSDLVSATSDAFDVAEVVSTHTMEYYQSFDLETETVPPCPLLCPPEVDFHFAYNSTAAVPTVVFHNRSVSGGRLIAHLAGRAFDEVHLADTTGAGLASTLINDSFDGTQTILIRSDAGHIYKLGNPVRTAVPGTPGTVTFDMARLD